MPFTFTSDNGNASSFCYIITQNYVLCLVYVDVEIGSLTPRADHRLMGFQNRVLREVYEPKKEEVVGGWRKLLIEELHNL
jgi:hypothetical protein